MIHIFDVTMTEGGKVKHELRVTSSNSQFTGSNPQGMSSNQRVTSSNPRVRRLKSRVKYWISRFYSIKLNYSSN